MTSPPPRHEEPRLKPIGFWMDLCGWIGVAFLFSGMAVTAWGLSTIKQTGDATTAYVGMSLCAFFTVLYSLMTWFSYRWKRELLRRPPS